MLLIVCRCHFLLILMTFLVFPVTFSYHLVMLLENTGNWSDLYNYIYVSIYVNSVYGLMCQSPCGSGTTVLVSCLVVLTFISLLSMIEISPLTDQYGCRSFCTSAFVNGQPQSMISESMPMFLSSSIANLISSATVQSSMSKHDSVTLMVIQMSGISSYLFYGCVWPVCDE